MPFKFRLKPLMKYREIKLRETQAALGAAVSARMRIESEIEQLIEIIDRESNQFEREREKGLEAARYLYFKDRLSFLERELLLLYAKLENASAEVETRKQAAIECHKSVKTLESIEARDRELYRLIESRREQKKIDDVAVLGACRNRPAEKPCRERPAQSTGPAGRRKENHESG